MRGAFVFEFVCPVAASLVMILFVNNVIADTPNDVNQSMQKDSKIINSIVWNDSIDEANRIDAVSSIRPTPLILKEYRWDGMSGLINSSTSMLKDDQGQTHILARGPDNTLWDNVDGVWQGLGGFMASDPCSVKDSLGVIHVFAIGSGSALFDWVSGTGWVNLGGHITSNPSAALSPDGHIKIAAKSIDDELLIRDLTTGEWSNLGGKIELNPQLIFDFQGKMHVLARGSGGALWDNVDGTWQNHSGMIASDPRSIISPFNPGFIYTSVRGENGALWINALDTASGISTWTDLGGTIMGVPSPSVDTDGVLHNFARGSDGGLWDNANGSWYSLGGSIISDPSAFRDRDGKLRVSVAVQGNELWVNTVGMGSTPTTLVGSFACDDNKIQSAIDAMSAGGIIKILSGSYPENVVINKRLTIAGTGNSTVTSFTLNAILGTDSRGITAPLVIVNAGSSILQAIDLASPGASIRVNGAAGYTYNDDLTQSFYAKGITLNGVDNPETKSISLDQDVAGMISGIVANTVNVNPDASILQAIDLANTGALVNVNGASGYTYSDDLDQSFYVKGIILIGINNPVISSFSLDHDIAGTISGIVANTVNVNPDAKILQAIELANAGGSINVNGADGYVYGDDLTQGFYAKGIALTGINNPVINSISLDQDVAGKISGIVANTINVNPNASILQAIELANAGALIKVNGAVGYTYNDDLTQSFYVKGITLSGVDNPETKSIFLDRDVAGMISGIVANIVNVNPDANILQAIELANTGAKVMVNGATGYTFGDDLDQSFYVKGIVLIGINNPVINSITLIQDVAGTISDIAANTVNVNPGAKILQAIELANAGGSVNVNGVVGYTYSDDLTQSFYAKGIALTGINNPVINSISLDQDVAGRICGIAVNIVNVNPDGSILQAIEMANAGGLVNANGAYGYTYGDDLTQGFYTKGITLTGINDPVTKSISLDQDVAGKISGIAANTVNVLNPNARIQDGIILVHSGGTISVNAGNYLEDIDINKDLILLGIGNSTVSSISLHAALGKNPYGINASKVSVYPPSRILDGILMSSKDVYINGASGYVYGDDLTQCFYENEIMLTGINNPVISSFTLDQDTAGKINGIVANVVNVNPGASILQAIELANAGASVDVNGAEGYTYSDDLTQSFYAKEITLTGYNGPVTKSISLDQDVAGKINGIDAKEVNVLNPNAKIQDGVLLASSAGTIDVAPGTYKENIIVDKSLKVNGAGAGSSIVDGNNTGSVFIIAKDDSQVDVSLSAMTLTGGSGTCDTVGTSGGGIHNYGNLIVTDCVISGNIAGCGGGIQNFGIATIADSTVSSNIAKTDGGGISSSGTLNLKDADISGNIAKESGGGIGNSGTLDLDGGSISGNIAVLGGGIGNSGAMTLKSGSITENTATEGGGIRNSGTLTLKSGSISGNAANVNGGGIGNSGTLNLYGGSITGNKAVYGGGIGNSGTLTLSSGSIAENTATDGGGIFSDNHGTMNIEGGRIDKNIANSSGGGIYSLGSTVNIDGGRITKNIANVSGGGIYSNNYVTINLNGGEIVGNSAAYYGGGIYSQGAAHLRGGNITGNMASDGGGIYSSGTITMSCGSIDSNAANNGSGGGCFNAGTLDLSGGIIAENEAINGGGVYSSIDSHIAFDGMQIFIKSNKAHHPSPSEYSWYQGWGVYLEDGTPDIKCNFDPVTQVTGNIQI